MVGELMISAGVRTMKYDMLAAKYVTVTINVPIIIALGRFL